MTTPAYESRVHALYSAKDSGQSDMKTKVAEILAIIPKDEGKTPSERSHLLFLRGKLLDCLEGYQEEAEMLLTQAVKLNPDSIDLWNCLGHCLWKKGDLTMAQSCLRKALALERNAESLRLQSQILRQTTPPGSPNRISVISDSVNIAKEAVSLNVRDSVSWYVLGNAYLVHFFEGPRDPKDLNAAMKAYRVAGGDERASSIPDLHYNRGNLHAYLEEYDSALQCYRRASQIDSEWNEPVMDAQRVVNLVQATSLGIDKKGHVRPNRLEDMARSIVLPPEGTVGGRRLVDVPDLIYGDNPRTVIATKLLSIIPNKEPQICIGLTTSSVCIALSLYSLAPDLLCEGDTITILDPHYRSNFITLGKSTIKYDCLVASTATNVLINGQPGASMVMIHGTL